MASTTTSTTTMSTTTTGGDDKAPPPPPDTTESGIQMKPQTFNSVDFMEFLAKQDISQLHFETKDGNRFSASFSGVIQTAGEDGSNTAFKSIDGLKSMIGDDPTENGTSAAFTPTLTQSMVTLSASTMPVSKDWTAELAKDHVEVTYDKAKCFEGDEDSEKGGPNNSKSSLPPKKRGGGGGTGGGGSYWDGMFSNALGPLVEAACREKPVGDTAAASAGGGAVPPPVNGHHHPHPHHHLGVVPPPPPPPYGAPHYHHHHHHHHPHHPSPYAQPPYTAALNGGGAAPGAKAGVGTGTGGGGSPNHPKPPSKRKPRKIIPENKEYVETYTDADVLFGRGGRSNHHPGNKIYRDIVTEKQPFYRSCDKNEKTRVAQSIVDAVTIDGKGRFLELDKATGMWYLVPNIVARRKVGQALRENNTEEARAAKREKYGQGKASKKKNKAAAAEKATTTSSSSVIVTPTTTTTTISAAAVAGGEQIAV